MHPTTSLRSLPTVAFRTVIQLHTIIIAHRETVIFKQAETNPFTP